MEKKTLSAEGLNKWAVRIIASSLFRPAIGRRFLGLLTFNNNPSFVYGAIVLRSELRYHPVGYDPDCLPVPSEQRCESAGPQRNGDRAQRQLAS